MHVLFVASTAFSLWMMVDAIQKGIACRWGWLIMLPGGEFAYFFAVKIHDFRPGGSGPARLVAGRRPAPIALFDLVGGTGKTPGLDELRDRVDQSPCLENRLSLACALYGAGEYRDALGQLEIALKQDDGNPETRYGAARCHMAMGEHGPAEAQLRAVIELQSSFDDYAAWIDLARVLADSGRRAEGIEVLEELERTVPRLEHSVYLASLLHEAGEDTRARAQLERALKDHERAPAHVRRLARRDAQAAKKLLAGLS